LTDPIRLLDAGWDLGSSGSELELQCKVFGDERWVPKLIARLLATAALWFRTSLKNTKWPTHSSPQKMYLQHWETNFNRAALKQLVWIQIRNWVSLLNGIKIRIETDPFTHRCFN
jgi:hypothetical protein